MCHDRLPGLLVLCSLLPAGAVRGQGEGPRPDYRDPAIPTARRVEDLLARMTTEEKVSQMLCLWNAKSQMTDAQGRFEVGPEQLSYHGPDLNRVVEPGRFRLMVGGSSTEVKSVNLEVVEL